MTALGEDPRDQYERTMLAWRRHRPGERSGLAHASSACGLGRETALHGALEDAWLCMQVWLWLHDLPVPEARADLLHPPSNWVEPEMKPVRGARKVMGW